MTAAEYAPRSKLALTGIAFHAKRGLQNFTGQGFSKWQQQLRSVASSVSTSGALTGQLLGQFANALSVSSAQTVAAGATSLPASDGKYDQTLIIPASMGGTISVPSGYEFVIYQGTAGTLSSSDAKKSSSVT